MVFGEDKRKVQNIVQANIPEFERLYSPFFPDLVEFLPDNQMMRVSASLHCIGNLFSVKGPQGSR